MNLTLFVLNKVAGILFPGWNDDSDLDKLPDFSTAEGYNM